MSYNCAHCGRQLSAAPEPDAGDWIIRCLACGAKSVINPALELIGWRE